MEVGVWYKGCMCTVVAGMGCGRPYGLRRSSLTVVCLQTVDANCSLV